ncbi:hypothetical protein C8R45DRAFT_321858 [Mycena sanguinolenta]|nr:hypothetical protein C8R45DRAFT_321858 [Mycena sanguinolenta]
MQQVTHHILWELHPAHVKHTLLLVPLLLCAHLTAVEIVVSGGFPGCWPPNFLERRRTSLCILLAILETITSYAPVRFERRSVFK